MQDRCRVYLKHPLTDTHHALLLNTAKRWDLPALSCKYVLAVKNGLFFIQFVSCSKAQTTGMYYYGPGRDEI